MLQRARIIIGQPYRWREEREEKREERRGRRRGEKDGERGGEWTGWWSVPHCSNVVAQQRTQLAVEGLPM